MTSFPFWMWLLGGPKGESCRQVDWAGKRAGQGGEFTACRTVLPEQLSLNGLISGHKEERESVCARAQFRFQHCPVEAF